MAGAVRSSFAAVMCFASCAAHTHAILHKAPAEDSAVGWERQSHPIGCGYFGANVFGRVDDERVQVTHNAVLKPDPKQARMAVLTEGLARDGREAAADLDAFDRT